jgi:hypothetical protein
VGVAEEGVVQNNNFLTVDVDKTLLMICGMSTTDKGGGGNRHLHQVIQCLLDEQLLHIQKYIFFYSVSYL